MKTKEIALRYEISKEDFEAFLSSYNLDYKDGITGISVDDVNVYKYVKMFKSEMAQKFQEDQQKSKALSSMLISSGFNFDGYRIVKYSGYISGDDAVQIPRSTFGFWGTTGNDNSTNLTNALVKIRRQALYELKEAAYNLGCNAVIGVDFDYITLDPQTANHTGGTTYEPYVICVTANGNAVVIERI